jgi:L-asparaginase
MKPLVFLSCGGTIEKIYLPDSGLLGFDRSRISEWAKSCRIAQPYRTETVMLKDSLDMQQTDREVLAQHIASLPETQIVVLHGTDTMVESANTVMLRRKENQVVVFTGAMVPASQADSDAFFNLGLATAAAQTLAPGVYIAMSGQLFLHNQVRKNKSLGVFELTELNSSPSGQPEHHSADAITDSGTLRITKRKITGFFR